MELGSSDCLSYPREKRSLAESSSPIGSNESSRPELATPRPEEAREPMKTTMSALAALALVAATDVRAQEGVGDAVQLAGSKDAKVTLVYQHALPGIPGKSVKGVLVEYGPGGYSPS